MTVVTDRTGDGEGSGHSRVLLGGRSGSGLSRTAATWPDPYFVLFGGSLRFAGDGLSFTRVSTPDEIIAVLTALSGQDLGAPVATAVIDTVDGMDRMVGSDPRKLRALLSAITALPLDVVLLCHVDSRTGPLMLDVSLPDGLAEFVDVALFLEAAPRRALGRYVCGWPDTRVPWVMDRTGLLPDFIDQGDVARVVARALAGTDEESPSDGLAVDQRPKPRARARVIPPPPSAPEPAPAAAVPPPEDPELGEDDPEPGEDDPELGDEGDLIFADVDPLKDGLCTSKGAQGNECLGAVEDQDSYDLSMLRFRRAMCGPCGTAEYEARPKAVPRKRPTPLTAAASPSTHPEAVVPRGEVVGRIPPSSDPDLRDMLRS